MLEKAYERIDAYLKAGEVVCIFPEGRITDNGDLYPFKKGITRIIERTPVPVIPMALSGLWQSLFARNRDKLRHIAKLFPKIGLSVGEPVAAAAATPAGLQEVVLRMRGDWK